MGDEHEPPWPPPLWVGWVILSGAPIIGYVSWAFSREDGVASVLLNGWYAVVCLVFGIVCIRAARSGGAQHGSLLGRGDEPER